MHYKIYRLWVTIQLANVNTIGSISTSDTLNYGVIKYHRITRRILGFQPMSLAKEKHFEDIKCLLICKFFLKSPQTDARIVQILILNDE